MARSLTKKIRFDVFKRDAFVCQYCGQTPPKVMLEVDHIVAVSLGGSDHIDNLITACFDCNRGKAASPLGMVPQSVVDKASIIKERELQLVELAKVMAKRRKRISADIEKIAEIYSKSFPGWKLTDHFKSDGLSMFIDRLPIHEVESSMVKACTRMSDPEKATKYFCGICWNLIKGGA